LKILIIQSDFQKAEDGKIQNNFPRYINLKIKIHKTVILPVVLYGCETWSLTWREAPRLCENRVLRIFGPESEEDGSWRKLRHEELHSLYSSPNIVKVIKSE
jgi:hypothetical protein